MFKYDFVRQKSLKSKIAAILFSPGVLALILYRLANYYYKSNHKYLSLFFYKQNIKKTGADIAPSAYIGKNVIIYHSVGIVIEGTSIIKDNVKIMHGVTLGVKYINDKNKRHPTIEKGVSIGSYSTILGDITIGHNTVIGSSTVIDKDIPPNVTVIGNPFRIIARNK